ncbi:MAG: hypothetical protein LBB80_07680 [Treponema sp.]|jgi:hypothetical protein|nr:hypothetical protein [Treponema sp.]
MSYIGIGLLLLGLSGCASTREVLVLYQYTEFSGIPQEEIRDTIREVFNEQHIKTLESRQTEGYEIETLWTEQIRFLDIVVALVRIFSASEVPRDQGRRYVKYLISIRDTHYRIRGLTITIDTSRRSFVDIEQAGKITGPVDIVPHTEAWDFMEKLVREINRRLGIGFYDYEIRRETIDAR